MLSEPEARQVVDKVHRDVTAALTTLGLQSLEPAGTDGEIEGWLQRIANMGWDALARDAARFSAVYRPIGILPPDQYLALVLQATEGCSYNRCAFCSFYRDRPFRIKETTEFREHMESVLQFIGEGISLRRSVFLADANAVCIPRDDLLRMLDDVNERMPMRARVADGPLNGIYSFVDAFSARDGGARKYSEMRHRDVRRLYLGVETGCGDLLRFLHKPQTPEDVRETFLEIREGGLNIGVILMVGIGGDKFAVQHVEETLDLVNSLPWVSNDLVFLSPLVEHPGLEYRRLAREAGIRSLSAEEVDHQFLSLRDGIRKHDGSLRTALYGIEEFLY